MLPTNTILVISGIVCVGVSGLAMYMAIPREGKPPSAWTKTELRASSLALCVIILLLAGVTMIVKGIF
jgi:hypothetical protein